MCCSYACSRRPRPPAAARLAVVTTGKSHATIVDLGRKQVVARPGVGLPSRGVAVTIDGLRAYVVSSNGTAGRLTALDLQTRAAIGQIGVPAGARGVALSG